MQQYFYVYVLPSDVEGMPLSLLEAMSYGRNLLARETYKKDRYDGNFVDVSACVFLC